MEAGKMDMAGFQAYSKRQKETINQDKKKDFSRELCDCSTLWIYKLCMYTL